MISLLSSFRFCFFVLFLFVFSLVMLNAVKHPSDDSVLAFTAPSLRLRMTARAGAFFFFFFAEPVRGAELMEPCPGEGFRLSVFSTLPEKKFFQAGEKIRERGDY